MDLAEMNSARMPGPGDFGPPEYHDDMELTWEEEIQMEADAILAECETFSGAKLFADIWVDLDGHAPHSLVGMIYAIATAPGDIKQCPTMAMINNVLRTEALRQAAERHPKPQEDRPC